MPDLKDITGQTINGLTGIEELGNGRIMICCTQCGAVFEGSKLQFKKGALLCKKYMCNKSIKHISTLEGTEEGEILCLKEFGARTVLVRCKKCGAEFRGARASFIKAVLRCTNEDCENHRGSTFQDTTGLVINGFTCIKELGNKKVEVECNLCKTRKVAAKQFFKNGKIACSNFECNRRSKSAHESAVGKTITQCVCIDECKGDRGDYRVKVQCLKCGYTFEMGSKQFARANFACSNCGTGNGTFRHRIAEHDINGIHVNKFIYKGRNGRNYYNCTIDNTEKVLSYEEIILGIEDMGTYEIVEMLENVGAKIKCTVCSSESIASYSHIPHGLLCTNCEIAKLKNKGITEI